jgi:hypothetical protein
VPSVGVPPSVQDQVTSHDAYLRQNTCPNSHPQCLLPVLDPGGSAQPAFIHHAHEHKNNNRNQLLQGPSSSSSSLSSSYSHSPYSLLSRICFPPRPRRIHAFHSNPRRDSTCQG